MDSDVDYSTMATDLLNAGMGDAGRLQFIQECLHSNKPLYNTDEKYLRQKYQELEDRLEILSGGKRKKPKAMLSEDVLDDIVDRALSKERQTAKTVLPQRPKKSLLRRLFARK